MSGGGGTITYRGRSLEEVLPKIREELGPDAVIERQRTGLVGGVGGFFQREMVEVDARPAHPGEHGALDVLAGADDEAALRAATAPPDPDRDEGLQAPAMRRIAEQSAPFADLLSDAEADQADDDWGAWAAEGGAAAPPPGGGPFGATPTTPEQHASPAPPPPSGPLGATPPTASPHAAAAYTGVPGASQQPALGPAPATPPAAAEQPAPEPRRSRPAAAATHEAALVERGLSPQLAAAVVGEAVSHAMPFAPARGGLKRQVRVTLARRIPVQAGLGAGRTIALVGPAGAGKTRAAAGLAAAYAAGSDLPVVCLALRPRDVGAELAELLDPHGVGVRPVDDGAAARAHIGARAGQALVVLDTPAVSPRDGDGIARLAGDLRAAGVTETHVVLPATVAGPVARAVLEAYAPLHPAALLVTHADETDHLGPLVDLAVADGRPLSYVAAGRDVDADLAPADPAALAARLLP
jgi:flagellar biosynthesis protein FlhF